MWITSVGSLYSIYTDILFEHPELTIWCPGPTVPHSIRSWRYGSECSNRGGGAGGGGGRGGGGEDEGGRSLLKAAWQVRKIDRFRSCVGSVRGPWGPWSPWVRGVRAGPWGPCVLWALIGPIPDERQQHCHSSLSDRIFFFSISVGRLRTCGETQLGLAACDFLFHVNRRAT